MSQKKKSDSGNAWIWAALAALAMAAAANAPQIVQSCGSCLGK